LRYRNEALNQISPTSSKKRGRAHTRTFTGLSEKEGPQARKLKPNPGLNRTCGLRGAKKFKEMTILAHRGGRAKAVQVLEKRVGKEEDPGINLPPRKKKHLQPKRASSDHHGLP